MPWEPRPATLSPKTERKYIKTVRCFIVVQNISHLRVKINYYLLNLFIQYWQKDFPFVLVDRYIIYIHIYTFFFTNSSHLKMEKFLIHWRKVSSDSYITNRVLSYHHVSQKTVTNFRRRLSYDMFLLQKSLQTVVPQRQAWFWILIELGCRLSV